MVRAMNTAAGFIVNRPLTDQERRAEPRSRPRRAALNQGIVLLALVAVGVMVLVLVGCEPGEGMKYTVDDSGGKMYRHIQDAVDDADDGDSIVVSPGTYYEVITIEKSLELVGSSPEDTIINGTGEGDVVTVNATDVLITGFNITGSGTTANDAGIQVLVDNCTVEGVLLTGNADGVILQGKENCKVQNCTITNNSKVGIDVSASYQYIFNNTITHNKRGIYIRTRYNIVERNDCSHNEVNGIYVSTTSGNRISWNICNHVGSTGIYLWDGDSNTFLNNEVCYAGSIGIMVYGYSEGNRFENCTINYNKYYGMKFGDSKYNKIKNCTFRGNDRGFQFLSYSHSNRIHSCNIFESATMGLHAVSNKDKNNATGNWWGDSTGPYHSGANPDGKGDNVSSHVTFDPWLEKMVIHRATAVIVLPEVGNVTEGEQVKFKGTTENDLPVQRYAWRSSLAGEFYNGSEASFTSSELVHGEHVVFLRVQDSQGVWSREVSTSLVVHMRPTAVIVSIQPNPAMVNGSVSFSGGGEYDGTLLRYVWRSSLDNAFYNDTGAEFDCTNLTPGNHTIYLRVLDSRGVWSDEVSSDLDIWKEEDGAGGNGGDNGGGNGGSDGEDGTGDDDEVGYIPGFGCAGLLIALVLVTLRARAVVGGERRR